LPLEENNEFTRDCLSLNHSLQKLRTDFEKKIEGCSVTQVKIFVQQSVSTAWYVGNGTFQDKW